MQVVLLILWAADLAPPQWPPMGTRSVARIPVLDRPNAPRRPPALLRPSVAHLFKFQNIFLDFPRQLANRAAPRCAYLPNPRSAPVNIEGACSAGSAPAPAIGIR